MGRDTIIDIMIGTYYGTYNALQTYDHYASIEFFGFFKTPWTNGREMIFPRPGRPRVVPTTGGEHLSIRSCAVTEKEKRNLDSLLQRV